MLSCDISKNIYIACHIANLFLLYDNLFASITVCDAYQIISRAYYFFLLVFFLFLCVLVFLFVCISFICFYFKVLKAYASHPINSTGKEEVTNLFR